MFEELLDISWLQFLEHAIQLTTAYLLALPIGLNRERGTRSAGLRTFPLVAVGACGYMLIGQYVLSSDDAHARVIYGIITGIGFIGGGAILKGHGEVHGTATAASIWNMGAIGIAVAWWRLETALLLAALNIVTLSVVKRLKHHIDEEPKQERGRGESGGSEKAEDSSGENESET